MIKPKRFRNKAPAQSIKDSAIAMRRLGLPLKAIAAETGYSLMTVWNWCEDARANPAAKCRRASSRPSRYQVTPGPSIRPDTAPSSVP